MKLLMISALVLGLVSVTASAQTNAALKTPVDSVSYSIGQEIASGLQKQGIEITGPALIQGMQDALNNKSAIPPEQMQACLNALQQKMMAKQQEMMDKQKAESAEAGEKAMKEGQAYLAANKKKKGVTTLPSGLQYEVIKEGAGKMPKATDNVSVHYKGTLTDGTVFDSSIDRGQPANFPVNGVIKGWVEALQLMKVGSKWRLVIPADLAYGANPPQGAPIPPNSVLVFEVELLAIQ
jgi:FKBP-type peptidyl-prolyl cis-trans isomerase FklB